MTVKVNAFTGIKPHWSFDTFKICDRQLGGGQGFINTCGGVIDEDDAVQGSADMGVEMNMVFMVNDLILKHQNNSPYLTRFYNSTEGYNEDGYSLNQHFGLMGKYWIFNYEHCLIETTDQSPYNVTEIDPSGARHVYTESGGTYTSPNGILKDLTKTAGEFDLQDRLGNTWHFKHLGSSDPDDPKLYRLEYIKDQNDVRVYVEWEEKYANPSTSSDPKWRISQISISTDQGTNKTAFITFEYLAKTITISETDYYFHFIKTMTDYAGNVWVYDYDDDGNLTKVTYPLNDSVLEYAYGIVSDLQTITDMNGNDWTVDYTNRTRSVVVGLATHTVGYTWVCTYNSGPQTTDVSCTKADEESYNWVYKHTTFPLMGITGTLHQFQTPIGTTNAPYQFTWTNNQLTMLEMPEAIDTSSGAYRIYYYLPGGISNEDPVAGSAHTNNGQGNLVISRFYDGSSWLEELREDYYFDSNNLLQWEGKDLISQTGSYGPYPNPLYFTKTKYEYDTNGNLVRSLTGINEASNIPDEPEETSLIAIEDYVYDSFGNLTEIVSPGDNRTLMTYEDYGALTDITDPLGYTLSMTWDERHLYLATMTDQIGGIYTSKYDLLGQLYERSDPLVNTRSFTYDGNGNQTIISEPMGNTYTTNYDAKNRITGLISPSGMKEDRTYDKRDLLYTITKYHDESSYTAADMTYDENGRVTKIRRTVTEGGSPVNKDTNIIYNADSLILIIIDPDGNVTIITYTAYGQIEEITYPYNKYDPLGTPSYVREKLKNFYSGPMGKLGRILKTAQTDSSSSFPSPSNVYTGETYDYDRLGRQIIRETSPDWHFDTSIANPTFGDNKFRTTNFYNSDGNLRVVEQSTWEWIDSDPDYWEFVSRNANYNEYNERGDLVKESHPIDGNSEENFNTYDISYEYDPRRLQVKSSRGGLVTRIMRYDAAGRMISSTSVSDLEKPISATRSLEIPSRYGESATIAPATSIAISSSRAFEITNQFEYDKNGNNTSVVDGNGIVREIKYDNENRPVVIIDGMKRTTTREYYPDSGWLKKIRKSNSDNVQYYYDEFGRITTVKEFSRGDKTATISADASMTISYTSGSYTFDGTAFTEANETVEFKVSGSAADGSYLQAFSTDKLGRIRYYHFFKDDVGPSDGTFYEYEYDGYGNLSKIIKPDTNTITYEYDKLNRMTKETLDPGTGNEVNDFSYDCCRMSDWTQTEGGDALPIHEFTYDLSGRLTEEVYKWVSQTVVAPPSTTYTDHKFNYSYDPAGRRVRMSDPYWSTLTSGEDSTPWYQHYTYDGIGRIKSTDRSRELSESMDGGETRKRPWAGETFLRSTGGEIYSTDYDPGGRPTRVTYPGHYGEAAIDVVYTYYDDNQVKSIVAHDLTDSDTPEIYALEYRYDDRGRKSSQTIWDSRDDSWPQYDIQYKYDNRDQLTRETYLRYNSTTERMDVYRERIYEYDNGGSMTKKTIYHESLWIDHTFEYSRGYHLVDWNWEIATGSGTPTSGTVTGITYDANGNLTAHGVLTITGNASIFSLVAVSLTYDVKNRLATYRFGVDDPRTLKWDAIGRIREKTWTDNHQVFYHDGRKLVQIWDQTVDEDPEDTFNYTRTCAYDLYRGQTGYQKDIDFVADPDVESFLIKDEQGTVRAAVTLGWSGGSYNLTVDRDGTLDAYGASLGSMSDMTNTHYMRYISTRVEDYGDEANQNQALIHTDHRHYLPYLGIFLQREPLMVMANQQSVGIFIKRALNLAPYRYVRNRPTIGTDQSGKDYAGYAECKSDGTLDALFAKLKRCYNSCWQQTLDNFDRIINCRLGLREQWIITTDLLDDAFELCMLTAQRVLYLCCLACLITAVGGPIALMACQAACLGWYLWEVNECIHKEYQDRVKRRADYEARRRKAQCLMMQALAYLKNCNIDCKIIYCREAIAANCLESCSGGEQSLAETDPHDDVRVFLAIQTLAAPECCVGKKVPEPNCGTAAPCDPVHRPHVSWN